MTSLRQQDNLMSLLLRSKYDMSLLIRLLVVANKLANSLYKYSHVQ